MVKATKLTLAAVLFAASASYAMAQAGAEPPHGSDANAPSAVQVNLATGVVTGGAGNDTLTNIQSVSGSEFDDTLTGNDSTNSLVGDLGNVVRGGCRGAAQPIGRVFERLDKRRSRLAVEGAQDAGLVQHDRIELR